MGVHCDILPEQLVTKIKVLYLSLFSIYKIDHIIIEIGIIILFPIYFT